VTQTKKRQGARKYAKNGRKKAKVRKKQTERRR
jgi:hypothetical protein